MPFLYLISPETNRYLNRSFLVETQGSHYYWHDGSFKVPHLFQFLFPGLCINLFYYIIWLISFQTFLYRHLKFSSTLENSVCYCYTSYEMTALSDCKLGPTHTDSNRQQLTPSHAGISIYYFITPTNFDQPHDYFYLFTQVRSVLRHLRLMARSRVNMQHWTAYTVIYICRFVKTRPTLSLLNELIFICSKGNGWRNVFTRYIRWAFKIVVDSWKFTMLLLYTLWDYWLIFMISGLN